MFLLLNFQEKKDVLILEEKIAAIEDDLSQVSLPNLEDIEAKGLNLTPGFMDQHVHITGGGGEGGPETRCPELQLSELILCGTTSVVGVLGTDGLSRTPSSVLAKSRALTRRHKCLDAYKQLFASAANADGIRERRSVLRA